MKKYVCLICGYVHNGDEPPAACPVCGAYADKFKDMGEAARLLLHLLPSLLTPWRGRMNTVWNCPGIGSGSRRRPAL